MSALRKGDRVRIRCMGVEAGADIVMASDNSRSLMLAFDAVIDGHVGMMPVLRNDDGIYRSIITGCEVKVTLL